MDGFAVSGQMTDKTTQHPIPELNPEASHRRLPFAPIFDTIVAEDAPTSGVRKLERKSYFGDLDPDFLAVRHAHWIVATAAVVIALVVLYLAVQARKQTQILTALATSSQASLRADEATMRLEQRPWVGVADAVAQPLTASGDAFTLQNSGKTPALDVHFSGNVMLTVSPQLTAANETTAPVQGSAGMLFPGAAYKTVVQFPIPVASVAALYRNQVRAVVHVSITYKDTLQGAHTPKLLLLAARLARSASMRPGQHRQLELRRCSPANKPRCPPELSGAILKNRRLPQVSVTCKRRMSKRRRPKSALHARMASRDREALTVTVSYKRRPECDSRGRISVSAHSIRSTSSRITRIACCWPG